MDNSYHRQTIETLWPLGETKQQGGLTELNDPTSGWLLSEVWEILGGAGAGHWHSMRLSVQILTKNLSVVVVVQWFNT